MVETVHKLSPGYQLQLAEELNKLINSKVNVQSAVSAILQLSLSDFVKKLSRTQGLIYRDWQAAIGDLMIKKAEKESRKYEVISFREFEAMNIHADEEQMRWLARANKLFSKLDVTVEERFDGRARQLRKIYAAIYQVLKAFSKINVSNVDIATNTLKNLPSKI